MTEKKRRRQESLVLAVRKEAFLTDEALARRLSVSVQTVRLSFHRQTHWHLRLSMHRSRSRGSRTSNIKPPSTRGIRSSRRRRS